jgi:exosome complex component MTR3
MAQSGFDRRRINSPNESFQPIFDDDFEDPSNLYKEWNLGQPRRKRLAEDIRPICAKHTAIIPLCSSLNEGDADLKTGLINQANGSAYLETERTKIACAVWVIVAVVFHNQR